MKNGDLPANVIFGRAGAEKMKHTAKSLAAMSDFERNKSLAELLGKKIEQHSIVGVGLQWCAVDENDDLHRIKDYCNNPSDVMPLVFKHKINLIFVVDEWKAFKHNLLHATYEVHDKKPLRAAACCLILVLQEIAK